VSIVIPTHNRKEILKRLLKSIYKSTYKHFEVIVVDDASSDKTVELINKTFSKSNLRIIRNKKNLYTAGSRNIGLKQCKGELIFFVDDDNVLDKNTIYSLVDVFIKDKNVGAVGPVNYSFSKQKQVLWFKTIRNMLTTKTYQPRSISIVKNKLIWETDDIPNAFMVNANVVRKNRITFREKFGIMYEESDFAYRIRNSGYKILVSKNAKIYHDIETKEKNKKTKDYMFHFMQDKRRPYVFARNRILFHSLYSSKIQLIIILLFWNWFFALYYIYKILFYSGVGEFSLIKRIYLSFQYLKGIAAGITIITSKNYEKKL
jgi:GT2 family glycosyltransferase